MIEDDGVPLRFRHDLLRDSLYEDLPASVRRGLHREAAQRLARSGAPALRVAEHFARGASEGDREAIGWLTRAAEEAAPGSPAAAASLLDRAVALMRPQDPGRDRLLAEWAGYLLLSGRIADAVTACRRLLGRAHDPAIEGAARMCLGWALLAQGRYRDALAEMERAADSPVLSGAERAAAEAWASFARMSLGDLNGAVAVGERAVASAEAVGDLLAASVATTSLALVCESRCQLGEALRLADEATRLAEESRRGQGRWYPAHLTRGGILVGLGRLEEARSVLHAGRRISEELGVRWALPSFGVFLGMERFIAGEWDDAPAELEASLELADEIGETFNVPVAHGVISLISLHRNDLGGARAAMDAAHADLASRGSLYPANWAAWPQALLLETSGEPAGALAALAAPWEETIRLGFSGGWYPDMGADLVRMAMAAGEVSLARQVAAVVGDVASRHDAAWLRGAALRCQGLAADDPGLLEAAALAYADASRPLELALAAEAAAVAYVEHGETQRARPLLDQAIATYERLNAARDLARADAILREMGVRRGIRGTRKRPQFGWPSLTPTELTVAALVADGLSNPQIGDRLFISRRTVQTHLAHMFAKLVPAPVGTASIAPPPGLRARRPGTSASWPMSDPDPVLNRGPGGDPRDPGQHRSAGGTPSGDLRRRARPG